MTCKNISSEVKKKKKEKKVYNMIWIYSAKLLEGTQ